MDYLSIYQMLHRRFWCKNGNDTEKVKIELFRPQTSANRKFLTYTISRLGKRTSNCGENMQSHVLRAQFSIFPSCISSFAVPRFPLPSTRPLVSRSLRYLCTLHSRTHVVVRMHTCAHIRRVLRKLAPYASIQISHVCTYSI